MLYQLQASRLYNYVYVSKAIDHTIYPAHKYYTSNTLHLLAG